MSDTEDGSEENAMGRKGGDKAKKSIIPMYSREDIREQYCINDKELQVLDNKRKKGILGCFSDNGHNGISPCTKHGKKYLLLIMSLCRKLIFTLPRSILTSCIAKSDSEDDISGHVKRPVSPGRTGTTWTGTRSGHQDDEDGFDENYFRRRPKSFYFDTRRPGPGPDPGVQLRMSHVNIADENYFRNMTMVN